MSDTFRTHDGRTLQQAASDLVQREVHLCLSSMVSALASGSSSVIHTGELQSLAEQALDLCSPGLDYEEAARQAGWRVVKGTCELPNAFRNDTLAGAVDEPADAIPGASPDDACGWENLCEEYGLDPYEWEVFEHWAVSAWLAEKLQAAGERIDTDFAGLIVWARTTTGQAISMNSVIERITREMHSDTAAA